MKRNTLLASCFAILAVACGCQKAVTNPTYPPTAGDFVTNSNSIGTAQAWGITFKVAAPAGNGARSHFNGFLSNEPEKTNASLDIAIGTDVKIRLEKVPGKPIAITLNNKGYGTVAVGDTVSVGKDRDVEVNGSLRNSD